jgi:hypothetical protein
MRSLRENGIAKLKAQKTSPEEIFRITQSIEKDLA